eukprot:TRINITY_DN46205_c0_g1_i1.p1 TRINITY_DN46205_c0_g1~~TRINITY_DN46205_c0_g1_i1.p1  ORF type:complete len:203 (-),score=56.54 TRINITY_DN46205_c0_g1_i1:105-713(-)
MLGKTNSIILMMILIQSAFGLPFELNDEMKDVGMNEQIVEVSDEAIDYYNSELDKADSSTSFGGNPEEALLKVLGEKDNTINVNIGELFDKLIASQHSEKTSSITPAIFFSTFINSLTKESMILMMLTPFIFLFLTSISAIVAVPTLLLGLSLMSERIEKSSPFDNFENIPEPIALPSLENIADIDYVNADTSAPRFWKDSY